MCSEISGEQPLFNALQEASQDASKFLALVGGPGAAFQFRAIPERPDVKGRARVENLLGTFAEDGPELTRLNRAGYGIFAVVNETAGTLDKNVIGIRCVFADLDKGLSGANERLLYFCGSPIDINRKANAGFAPASALVETSPGRFAAYWRTHSFPLGRFKAFQHGLAAVLGSDPSVCNPSRVMRLPGFLHQKGSPFLSRAVHIKTGYPYSVSFASLEKALARTAKRFRVKIGGTAKVAPVASPEFDIRSIEGLLGRVAIAEPGERNNVLYWAACRFKERGAPAAAWGLLREAARPCGLAERELACAIASASKRAAT